MNCHYKTERQIRTLVNAFETCQIHPSEFKHYQHLTVALWYLSHLPYDEAVERMKRGIQRLAASYGKTGYHETITEFWLRLVRSFLEGVKDSDSLAALANQCIARYGNAKLISAYDSNELLTSPQAKTGWIEPDLQPMG